MANPSNAPSSIPSGGPDEGKQLGLLLDVAKDLVGEESRRTERLETRSRHVFTASGALFAVVMATTAGVLNALLNAESGNLASWVIPVIGGFALVAIVTLLGGLFLTLRVQSLQRSGALSPATVEQYVSYAEKGNVAVGKQLIKAYADVLRVRRGNNDQRTRYLKCASLACGVAALASLSQLAAVFIALITK